MIRTVCGDVTGDALGRIDYHEHAFQASPLLPGDELDDFERSTQEFRQLRESGFPVAVEATPIGLGRRPRELTRLSLAAGIKVIATTGAHRDAHYGSGHWLPGLAEDRLADYLIADIEEGMPVADGPDPHRGPAPRAGVLKVGIDYWAITAFERRVLAAAGRAHALTNAPVMVHLEHGSAAIEVLALLADEGVAAEAVVLAHADRSPDPVLHAELAATGAYLGYDGWARSQRWPDSVLLDCLRRTAEAGGADRIVLGGDVARRSRYLAYGGMPGLRYLGDRVLPRLAALGGPDLLNRITVCNPRRLLDRF